MHWISLDQCWLTLYRCQACFFVSCMCSLQQVRMLILHVHCLSTPYHLFSLWFQHCGTECLLSSCFYVVPWFVILFQYSARVCYACPQSLCICLDELLLTSFWLLATSPCSLPSCIAKWVLTPHCQCSWKSCTCTIISWWGLCQSHGVTSAQ